jgi:hypothetical protein
MFDNSHLDKPPNDQARIGDLQQIGSILKSNPNQSTIGAVGHTLGSLMAPVLDVESGL